MHNPKPLGTGITVSTLLGSCAWVQDNANIGDLNNATPEVTYKFDNVVFSGDTFVQLLGINKNDTIAGYHGSGLAGHPNQGFVLTLPKSFTAENVPHALQTQVIGINDQNESAGFFVDAAGVTHGFLHDAVRFKQVDSIFDRFGNVFLVLTIPGAVGGAQATGINDGGSIYGFYIDAANVNQGFLLTPGKLKTLDFPESFFTQALGVDKDNNVVGVYLDKGRLSHGFLFTSNNGKYQSIDDPYGYGTTLVNGINADGKIVGFYVDSKGNTDSFVGTPEK